MNFQLLARTCKNLILSFKKEVLTINCLKVIVYVLVIMFLPPTFAQNSASVLKIIKQGSSVDSIFGYPASKGKVFLSVKTYYTEYSLSKPALVTQFIFDKIDSNQNVLITYQYLNNLIKLKVNTNIWLVINKPLSLHLDDDRRNPIRFVYQLVYRKEELVIELL